MTSNLGTVEMALGPPSVTFPFTYQNGTLYKVDHQYIWVNINIAHTFWTGGLQESRAQEAHFASFCDVAVTVKFYCKCDVAKSFRMGPIGIHVR